MGNTDNEKNAARREIGGIKADISRLQGYVNTIAWDVGYSSDDVPEDDERGELSRKREQFKELTERYEERFGEPYN